MNDVTAQFGTTDGRFAARLPDILREVCAATGFEPGEEIWRGRVVAAEKVATQIVSGTWQGKPAALKLQGIPLQFEEAELIRRFTIMNASERIRAPQVYQHEPWDASRGYGWTIMELVQMRLPIYSPPDAPERARRRFADFYVEFHGKTAQHPFFPNEEPMLDTPAFLEKRLLTWLDINATAPEHNRMLVGEQRALVAAYKLQIAARGPELPMIFTHGHLGPRDIVCEGIGKYVLFGHAFWGWRPLWYDLAFNVWINLMAAGEHAVPSDVGLRQIVEDWAATYAQLPMAMSDHHFIRNFRFMMIERCIGALLVDIPAGVRSAEGEQARSGHREAVYVLARRMLKELGG
ncbi:MAG: hypothetical protein AAB974_03070 [Patescibacteria group bacterium]